MYLLLIFLTFIVGIAIATVSFKAKKESLYYLLLSTGTMMFFLGIYMAVPK
ncbi:hypothetical protein [Companilactobacillus baiquanensis]|uniref:DUF2759 domain-containing protein n=1 Tax=Companilactobacillus baiquanensis TaxID=2486005 RepID=A0ABW1UUP6_9LACO|nr:hypothetical protein [Companilactobacillus baiquanensis]